MAATITVICPFCNNRMRASAEYTGRKGRCPSCKALLEIRPADEPSMESIHPTAAAFPRVLDARLGSTAVSGWRSGTIAGAMTAALYAAIWGVWKATGYGALVVDRGPMPFFILLLAAWGLVMLVMKYGAVRRHQGYAERELELIPLEVGVQITPDNVDQFLDHLAGRPRMQRLSIVGRRIEGALEHFKSRQSVPEVQQYLATQAELDASAVDSGYTLLRSFIWAIPILGFIGTVMGISNAVAGLEVAGEDGGQQIMEGIRLVTGGLASAFDTTLLALLMAVALLFPTESLRKSEYAMLDRIEAFANESLLRRMAESRGPVAGEQLPDVVRNALDAAFREHQRWLAEWQAQVGRLGQAVGTDLEAGVARMLEQIRQSESARLEKHEKLIHLLEDLSRKAAEQTADNQKSGEQASLNSREFLDAAGKLERALADLSGRHEEIACRQQQMWEAYSDGDVAALAEQIGKLAGVLESRGDPGDARGGAGGDVIEPVADPSAKQTPSVGLLGRLFGKR